MIHLPEIKNADLSTYRNFAKCHQAHSHFRVPRVGLHGYEANAQRGRVSIFPFLPVYSYLVALLSNG